MTVAFLLDTGIVSAPIAPRPNTAIVLRLEEHTEACVLAAPVWHELNYGALRLPRGSRRTALEEYLAGVSTTFPILPYDEKAASWHARERVRLEKAGTPAPYIDGQIASIAYTSSLVLVTTNPSDFERFENLDIETWSTG